MEELSHRKRVRDNSAEFDTELVDSIKVKRIRDDLLSLLDDSDTVPDRDSVSQDLESVIRSFEEEISGGTGSGTGSNDPASFVDLTSDSGESTSDIGKLLSGSLDDGQRYDELVRVSSDSSGIDEIWDFQDELQTYDSFEFGTSYYFGDNNTGDNNDYVALDGIFDHPDVKFGSDLSWRHETNTLPAL